MELKKPDDAPAFENTRNLIPGQPPITIKAGLILGIGNEEV